MRFDVSLDRIIGSKARLKLLKYLFGPQAAMSENELAKIVGVSPMTINRLMKELFSLNLVHKQRVGNSSVWSVNKESYAYTVFFGIIKDTLRLPSPLGHLKKTIANGIPAGLVKKAVLFGSTAKAAARVNSDIDLFVLVKSEKEACKLSPYLEKLSSACFSLYGNSFAPYVLTEAQLEKKKNLSIFKEIEKGTRII